MLAPMTPPWPATTQSLRWVGLLLLLLLVLVLLLHRAAQICSWLVTAVLEQRYYNAGPVPLAPTHTTTHSLARLLTYQRCGPYSGCMQVGVDIPERQQIAVPTGGVRGQYVIIYTGYLSEVRAQAGGRAGSGNSNRPALRVNPTSDSCCWCSEQLVAVPLWGPAGEHVCV